MRFGILGDAKIAREKLVPALRRAGCDIVHLGRRDKLASVSDDIWQGVKTGSYEDVLADPKVEAVSRACKRRSRNQKLHSSN